MHDVRHPKWKKNQNVALKLAGHQFNQLVLNKSKDDTISTDSVMHTKSNLQIVDTNFDRCNMRLERTVVVFPLLALT